MNLPVDGEAREVHALSRWMDSSDGALIASQLRYNPAEPKVNCLLGEGHLVNSAQTHQYWEMAKPTHDVKLQVDRQQNLKCGDRLWK